MSVLFEGAISVKAAIEGDKREVNELWVDQRKLNRDYQYIIHQAESKNIPVRYCTTNEIQNKANGNTHGGILAMGKERKFDVLPDEKPDHPVFYAYLEGLEDPFNYGYALRTLYAAGCDGVFVNRRSNEQESTIMKSSAGAYDKIQIYEMNDSVFNYLEQNHIHILLANRSNAVNLYEVNFKDDIIVAFGGILRGLSKEWKSRGDSFYIPYANNFKNALNMTNATAVVAFEVYRQRMEKLV